MAASAARSSFAGRGGRVEVLRAGAATVLFAGVLVVVDLGDDLSAVRFAREPVVFFAALFAAGFLSVVFLAALFVGFRLIAVFAAVFFAVDLVVVFLAADLATRLRVEVFFAGLMGGGR